jgi:hypothetical protein
MKAIDDKPDRGWSIACDGNVATTTLLRDLNAEDAFPLRNALAQQTAGCTELVFDVSSATYVAHSVQAVIRAECLDRTKVTLSGITDRLRRVLRTDSVQLLDAVLEAK